MESTIYIYTYYNDDIKIGKIRQVMTMKSANLCQLLVISSVLKLVSFILRYCYCYKFRCSLDSKTLPINLLQYVK